MGWARDAVKLVNSIPWSCWPSRGTDHQCVHQEHHRAKATSELGESVLRLHTNADMDGLDVNWGQRCLQDCRNRTVGRSSTRTFSLGGAAGAHPTSEHPQPVRAGGASCCHFRHSAIVGTMAAPAAPTDWPEFPHEGAWVETGQYVHLISQMLGKLKLALAPALPEWNHASLQFSARGLTTSALPAGDRAVEASIDVFDSALSIATSDGQVRTIALDPPQTVAEVWRQFAAALDEVGIEVNLWDKPQELDDVTPFADDLRPRSFEPKLTQAGLLS